MDLREKESVVVSVVVPAFVYAVVPAVVAAFGTAVVSANNYFES